MNYQKNYITLIQYHRYRQSGIRYTGFVIGYGYVRSMDKVILPPNQHGYNCLVPNLPSHASHCILIMDYVEERTLETIKQSLKGLFQNGIATYIVQKGDTLSHIALWFDVSVEDILAWNPTITNPNMIIDGQKIIIKEKKEINNEPSITNQSNSKSSQSSFLSHTTSTKGEKGLENAFLKATSYTKKTTALDEPRIFNRDILTTVNSNNITMINIMHELNTQFIKGSISVGNSLSLSAGVSANGYIDVGVNIDFNQLWDLCVSLDMSGDLDKDGISTGWSVGIKPATPIVVFALIFLSRFAPPIPITPSFIGGTTTPNKEFY